MVVPFGLSNQRIGHSFETEKFLPRKELDTYFVAKFDTTWINDARSGSLKQLHKVNWATAEDTYPGRTIITVPAPNVHGSV